MCKTCFNWFQISKVPPKQVTHRVVACEGDPNPALGHPKVYINLESHEPVILLFNFLSVAMD